MIGRLRGTVAEKRPPQLLVDVGGVGYELEAPMSTFAALPAVGEEVTLRTHLAVREDAHLLYGFATESERALFRTLIRISGVGAKLALTILSGISAAEFERSVREEDTTTLTRLPGVGKKTAQRLVVEMRDRLGEWEAPPAPAAVEAGAEPPAADPVKEAVGALVALGYKAQEASRFVNSVESDGKSSEEIIRAALREAVR